MSDKYLVYFNEVLFLVKKDCKFACRYVVALVTW